MAKVRDNDVLVTWTIIALKSPSEAKSRLRPHCTEEERRGLYFLMARQVLLALLAVPAIEQVLAVTASDEVAKFVTDLGGSVVRQAQDRGAQAAFAHALQVVMHGDVPPPGRLLMIPGDLPLITAVAVSELLDRCHQRQGVAIIPDQRQRGTNGLVCSPPNAVEPGFGEDSLRRHWSAARARGHEVQVIESPALSLDIDDHEDLVLLYERLASSAESDRHAGLSGWLDGYFSRIASPVE